MNLETAFNLIDIYKTIYKKDEEVSNIIGGGSNGDSFFNQLKDNLLNTILDGCGFPQDNTEELFDKFSHDSENREDYYCRDFLYELISCYCRDEIDKDSLIELYSHHYNTNSK